MEHIVVIGGGLSGLVTAFNIKHNAAGKNRQIKIIIIEKEHRVGGKIWSRFDSGYMCEWGPNGFLTNKPQTLELCNKLGISNSLLSSNDNARKRFVVSDGHLHKLPHSQLEFLTNSLISLRGKMRIACEVFINKRNANSDESLANFTRRRLGQEALDKLIAPMASGIFAGDPEYMSLQACFPRINQLEQQYGSLLKAMICLAKEHRKNKKTGVISASPAGPGGVLTSFNNGTQELTDALYNAIGKDNVIHTNVTSIEQLSNLSWQIDCGNQTMFADKVVLATPAYAASQITHKLSPLLSQYFATIKYSPLAIVCLGYDAKKVRQDVNGFGYLFANNEEKYALGTLWDSSIFANRAPDDKILFRTMLGGAKFSNILNLSDNELKVYTEGTLSRVMGINIKPEFVQAYRHEKAIPQYNLEHKKLITKIENEISKFQGLFIVGNAYYGIGINDCVAAGEVIANKVIPIN